MIGSEKRWAEGLRAQGHDEPSIAARLVELARFCERRGTTPDELVDDWLQHPELTVRRRPGTADQPDLVIESFVIHNGVNVFGDLVCVPTTPEQLALQGPQFVRAAADGKE